MVLFGASAVYGAGVEEASGITRRGDTLLIVGDKSPGAYYTYPVARIQEPLITIDAALSTRIELPEGRLALDLEGIAVLADGRVVVLSERLRALVEAEGLVVEYGSPLTEFGNRGLEGVAVLPGEDGSSRVAVLWEGGYPEYEQMPRQLRAGVGRPSLRPIIWIHTVARGKSGLQVKDSHTGLQGVHTIELQVPVPDGIEPPDGQRFRAPDLVWHRWQGRNQEELALLCC